jgi:acylphosphatase
MVTKKITVYGIVQGVGFRAFAQEVAVTLGVKGWVKNTEEGNVEILAQAGGENIDKFINQLYVGPRGARVEKIEQQDAETRVLTGFEIGY